MGGKPKFEAMLIEMWNLKARRARGDWRLGRSGDTA